MVYGTDASPLRASDYSFEVAAVRNINNVLLSICVFGYWESVACCYYLAEIMKKFVSAHTAQYTW